MLYRDANTLNKQSSSYAMSSDDYPVQNIYKYSRKTYKKNRRGPHEIDVVSPHDDNTNGADNSPRSEVRSDGLAMDSPGCSCDFDPEGEIAHILHKKCPVITLAQQQLQRLLDETDKLLCDNTRCCRSIYDFICICKDILVTQNKWRCAIVILISVAFLVGLLLGAASCGSYHGKFSSPILTCIDNFFIPETYANIEDTYRSIV